ncbi:DUF2147 domain-containing protein [Nonlabens xiamenensis]|uniref:DUF2147 domain-containing protein n=1 Tax=Nonlabens xiamenensis TaxID=2341043 RepID=UPI000F60D3F5|nr:DUF2147 domain-containing protein [Nonlabens xiamenensis]
MKKTYIFILLALVFAFAKAQQQDITGTWKTVDDETGVVKSHVEIYKKGNRYYGKVVKILDPDAPANATCRECPGDLKDQPILGLEIIRRLEKKGSSYKNGEIIDPENGKKYDCKIWLNEDNPDLLMVRGYVLFLYRTQTWQRV